MTLYELASKDPFAALRRYLGDHEAPPFILGALETVAARAVAQRPEGAVVGQAIADLSTANAMNADLDKRLGRAHVEIARLREHLSRNALTHEATCAEYDLQISDCGKLLTALRDAIDHAIARAVHPAGELRVVQVPCALWDAVLEARTAAP